MQQYQGAMRAVAIAIVGSASADEVVQDSWLAVVRNLPGFAGRSSLKTWLLTITANTAKIACASSDAKSRWKMSPGHMAALMTPALPMMVIGAGRPPSGTRDSPEALLSEQALRDCLEHTLATLSEVQRSVLLLRERQALELPDICNLLDISHSNVRVLLHRARLSVFAHPGAF
ncbi:RNA polymerase sigma factor [Halopseudomonas pachastrellae]|nr:RNA polymerase sigma factor [Halopseudomonas pachastrellae]